ncbi:hypothetical protein [Desertibaculum subflavum]|uniref:hypothetical protein n=1 Tax=Desertibaculum subflavum TaxID=2268458 RepID=UPI000E66A188
MSPLPHALLVLAIYLVPFLVLGWLAKRWLGRWMESRGVDLGQYRADQGPNRRPRDAFLLGAWRKEDP